MTQEIDLMRVLTDSLAREPKDHGLMFTAPMIRMILIGQKRETRRLKTRVRPGDRIWCKETWRPISVCYREWIGVQYAADFAMLDRPYPAHDPKQLDLSRKTWRSSMMMPKWATRIWLDVRAVREEQLQQITSEGARAEGAIGSPDQLIADFQKLWDSIHTEPGERWQDNPTVTVLSFVPVFDR